MKLQTLFRACRKIVNSRLKQHPDIKVKVDEEYIRLDTIVSELSNLENWCYKEEFEIEKIVRCRNCKHYKIYKVKGEENPYKHSLSCSCEYTKLDHGADFFCARGEEKEK